MSCIPPRSAGLAIHPQGKMRSYLGIVRVGVLATMLLCASAACTRPGESLVADLKQLDRDTRRFSFDATAVVTAHFRPGTSKAAAIGLLRRERFEYSPAKEAKPGEDIIFAARGLGGPFHWFGHSAVRIKVIFDNDKIVSSEAHVFYRGI